MSARPTPDTPLLSLDAAGHAGMAAGFLSRLGEPGEATRQELERLAGLHAQVSVAISLSAIASAAERGEAR